MINIAINTYFKLVKDKEHYLLAKEIAQVFNIKSLSGKYHSQLVSAILKQYIKDKDLEEFYCFSPTKQKFYNVYPKSIYILAITKFLFEQLVEHETKETSTTIAGKKFLFILEEDVKAKTKEAYEYALRRISSNKSDDDLLNIASWPKG